MSPQPPPQQSQPAAVPGPAAALRRPATSSAAAVPPPFAVSSATISCGRPGVKSSARGSVLASLPSPSSPPGLVRDDATPGPSARGCRAGDPPPLSDVAARNPWRPRPRGRVHPVDGDDNLSSVVWRRGLRPRQPAGCRSPFPPRPRPRRPQRGAAAAALHSPSIFPRPSGSTCLLEWLFQCYSDPCGIKSPELV